MSFIRTAKLLVKSSSQNRLTLHAETRTLVLSLLTQALSTQQLASQRVLLLEQAETKLSSVPTSVLADEKTKLTLVKDITSLKTLLEEYQYKINSLPPDLIEDKTTLTEIAGVLQITVKDMITEMSQQLAQCNAADLQARITELKGQVKLLTESVELMQTNMIEAARINFAFITRKLQNSMEADEAKLQRQMENMHQEYGGLFKRYQPRLDDESDSDTEELDDEQDSSPRPSIS